MTSFSKSGTAMAVLTFTLVQLVSCSSVIKTAIGIRNSNGSMVMRNVAAVVDIPSAYPTVLLTCQPTINGPSSKSELSYEWKCGKLSPDAGDESNPTAFIWTVCSKDQQLKVTLESESDSCNRTSAIGTQSQYFRCVARGQHGNVSSSAISEVVYVQSPRSDCILPTEIPMTFPKEKLGTWFFVAVSFVLLEFGIICFLLLLFLCKKSRWSLGKRGSARIKNFNHADDAGEQQVLTNPTRRGGLAITSRQSTTDEDGYILPIMHADIVTCRTADSKSDITDIDRMEQSRPNTSLIGHYMEVSLGDENGDDSYENPRSPLYENLANITLTRRH